MCGVAVVPVLFISLDTRTRHHQWVIWQRKFDDLPALYDGAEWTPGLAEGPQRVPTVIEAGLDNARRLRQHHIRRARPGRGTTQ